jgi:hypothetical protein
MITLDVGHAVSCERAMIGELSLLDFIDAFQNRLVEVHMYGRELERHYPIVRIDGFEDAIDRLVMTDCRWWTIELDDYEEALVTRQVLCEYLGKSIPV